jgi:hypothetical protein
MSQILDVTADSVSRFHEHGDEFTISQSTDVSAALRRNEQLRSAGMTKTGDGDHFAASIPIDLLQAWAVERGTSWEVVANDNKMLDRFLAEHTKCRVYEGRIS